MSTLPLQTADDAPTGNAFFETWGVRPTMDWTSLVLPCITIRNRPIGYVFVRDTRRPDFWRGQYIPKWKLAGGHKNPKDGDPRKTANRELEEETPLRLLRDEANTMHLAGHHLAKDRSHQKFYFSIMLERAEEKFNWAAFRGNEGEEAGFFSLSDTMRLLSQEGFLSHHQMKLKEYGLII